MPLPDLTDFIPLPHNPAYLVHPDGRVASLKKETPHILSEQRAVSPVWWRVRLGHNEVRVRDLVLILFGDTSQFHRRAQAWAESLPPRPEPGEPPDGVW